VFDLSHPKLKKLATIEGYDDVTAFLIERCDDSVYPTSDPELGRRDR
jgi:hypothetical protein